MEVADHTAMTLFGGRERRRRVKPAMKVVGLFRLKTGMECKTKEQ